LCFYDWGGIYRFIGNSVSSNLFDDDKGYTIVELIIVIVVIAILTGIGYVIYSGSIRKANTSSLQNDLTTAAD